MCLRRNGTRKRLEEMSLQCADNSAPAFPGPTTTHHTTCTSAYSPQLGILEMSLTCHSYLYGGFGIQNSTGFDDSYILSLPTFTWIKSFPTNNTSTPYGHGACSGDVINRDQMLIIGGWFPSTDACDAPNGWGQHNMNLGYNGPSNTLWDKYDPKVSTYFVPTPVISVVGGG